MWNHTGYIGTSNQPDIRNMAEVYHHADSGSIPDSTTSKKSLSIAYISFNSCYFLISFYIFNLINILSLSIDDEERSVDEECIC